MKNKYLLTSAVVGMLVCVQFAAAGVANLPSGVISVSAGVPENGANAVHDLTFGAGITGGTYRLRFERHNTAPIPWSGTNATLMSNLQSALRALPNIGVDGVTVSVGPGLTGGHGVVHIAYAGVKTARRVVGEIEVFDNSLTGTTHTLTVSTFAAGVTADGRDYTHAGLCLDVAHSQLYASASPGPLVFWRPITSSAFAPLTVASLTVDTSNVDDTVAYSDAISAVESIDVGHLQVSFSGSPENLLAVVSTNYPSGSAWCSADGLAAPPFDIFVYDSLGNPVDAVITVLFFR